MVLLDFSKAFDSVTHQRLLSKLNYYGIRDRSLDWIKAFLTDRTQVVSIIGTLSNPRPVVSEVPKWSSLGLVLFQLYVNDITDNISSHMRLFADDVVIYRESNTQKDHLALQQDLDN